MPGILRTLFVLTLVASQTLAAEPRVLFEDSFDEKLGEGWTWLREEPTSWRIADGALEILVQTGKADSVKNALVRTAPDRSQSHYAVEVTVTFASPPIQQYEQGGITWYYRQKPVFKLVHENIDGAQWIIPGHVPAPSKTVQLRLLVQGSQWTAQFREDLQGEFIPAATGELPPPGEDQISLQCYDGPPNARHWIRFDNFRILQLSD